MTHMRMSLPMGAMMGAMVPLMVHGDMAGAGLAFILAHVAGILAVAALALVVPSVRQRLVAHRPTPRAVAVMAGVAAFTFTLVCSHCVVSGHSMPHWIGA